MVLIFFICILNILCYLIIIIKIKIFIIKLRKNNNKLYIIYFINTLFLYPNFKRSKLTFWPFFFNTNCWLWNEGRPYGYRYPYGRDVEDLQVWPRRLSLSRETCIQFNSIFPSILQSSLSLLQLSLQERKRKNQEKIFGYPPPDSPLCPPLHHKFRITYFWLSIVFRLGFLCFIVVFFSSHTAFCSGIIHSGLIELEF